MDRPVYEIPVNAGLRDEPPVAPPGLPPAGPPQGQAPPLYPVPPSFEQLMGAPVAPPTSVPGLDFPPPTLPPVAAPMAAPAFASAPPPAMPGSAPASASAPAPTLASFPPPAAPQSDEWLHANPREGADPDLLAALQQVLMESASDLHIAANSTPMIRVDGTLRPATQVPWERHKVMSALYSIMNAEQQEKFERELELDFAFSLSSSARFRVNYYQQRNAIGAAFRLIPTEIKQLRDLGVPDAVGRFAAMPRGLVLVTGPTGSGKSTTLAALVDLVNRTRADHIVTIEDPIEFLHTNQRSLVNQREVGSDTKSFTAALKHVLRQDPDVILVGELRDLETISVALTAAETGHLVFATLHTQDAPQTIDRMIDVFPPHQQGQIRSQLAATLQGVVCQTLVKSSSGTGRVVATELMFMTPAVANMVREGKTYQIRSAMQAGRDMGMHTLDQHLADLVNEGRVNYESAVEKVHDHEGFQRLVRRTTGGAA